MCVLFLKQVQLAELLDAGSWAQKEQRNTSPSDAVSRNVLNNVKSDPKSIS